MTSIRLDQVLFTRESFQLGPISLTFSSGSRTALVGPSGSGKTTLLRCLAGLERPTSGSIYFGEQRVSGSGVLVPPEQRGIGFVFQRGALWPHMTAIDHIRFVAPSLSREETLGWMARVGLDASMASRRPHELSGGEAQRLAIARALAPKPSLLLLDEPLASVDPHHRDELALLIRRLATESEVTLIAVTHERTEALAMSESLAVLRDGQLMEHASCEELMMRPRTAFAANFLHHATCYETTPTANGSLDTPFGIVDHPGGNHRYWLAILPGDVETSDDGIPTSIIRCEASPRGFLAYADVAGRSVPLFQDEPLRSGAMVSLRLSGPPRLLPDRWVEVER